MEFGRELRSNLRTAVTFAALFLIRPGLVDGTRESANWL